MLKNFRLLMRKVLILPTHKGYCRLCGADGGASLHDEHRYATRDTPRPSRTCVKYEKRVSHGAIPRGTCGHESDTRQKRAKTRKIL